MVLDELVSAALLGTRGTAIRLSGMPAELAAELAPNGGDAEARFLDAAAAATLWSRAGAKPRRGIALPEPCPPDHWPECSPRAADVLAQADERGWQPLRLEWLELAAAAGRRPPHRLLPRLLEMAAAKHALVPAVTAVIGERGRWLMQFDTRWQFANPSNATTDEAWQFGNRQQRGEALRTARMSDAARAREMILGTWQEDAAEERAEWVGCLLTGLSDADEEFLESCLDDRSVRVREAAADLLARLPNSRLVARSIERVAACMTFTPAASGNVLKLKRPTKARLEVTLPAAFDKSMQRDGLGEKPSEALGPKQWWLLQMIGYVPLDYWTRSCGGVTVPELVAAVPSEYATVFTRGWLDALVRRPVVEWIEPLLAAAATAGRCDRPLLAAIPQSMRGSTLRVMVRASEQPERFLSSLLEAWRPLDEPTSRRLLDEFELPVLLACGAHFHLHSATLAGWESDLQRASNAAEQRRMIDQALEVIALRRDMNKELVP